MSTIPPNNVAHLPLGANVKIPFTPPHLYTEDDREAGKTKPVIWIRPMSIRDRANWRATVASHGARVIADSEMQAARRELLGDLQMSEAEIDSVLALYELAIAARNEGRLLGRAEQVQLSEIERLLSASDHYRMLVQTNAFYLEIAPLLALQQQCIGWNDLPGKDGKPAIFKRVQGQVSDEALQALDPLTLMLAGFRAMGLATVSEDDAKKSESPSS